MKLSFDVDAISSRKALSREKIILEVLEYMDDVGMVKSKRMNPRIDLKVSGVQFDYLTVEKGVINLPAKISSTINEVGLNNFVTNLTASNGLEQKGAMELIGVVMVKLLQGSRMSSLEPLPTLNTIRGEGWTKIADCRAICGSIILKRQYDFALQTCLANIKLALRRCREIETYE